MEVKDVTSLPWKKVTDWSELSASEIDFLGDRCVCETDVNVFVENVYRDISRKLNIPYEHLKPILKDENEAFYTLKGRLFKGGSRYEKKNSILIELENTLRVPDISNIENDVIEDKVGICFKLFEELSDIEKTIFLQKIGKINVKIECFAVQTEETVVE